MRKFVFVILHYMAYEDTKECIDSIFKKLADDKNRNLFDVIVVDNGSTNNSFEELIEDFKNIPNIHFLKLKVNLGFARGNNVGYKYAKYKLNADFIIMMNNDTIMVQNDFLKKIEKLYEETKFSVLGPDIINLKGFHQNPVEFINISKGKDYIKHILKIFIIMILNILGLYEFSKKLKNKVFKFRNENVIKKEKHFEKEMKNVKLHGSCWIFSKIFIDNFDGLYDETFMYLEEDILYYILQKENMITLYSPKLKIIHKEDVSTDYILRKSRKKRTFILKNLLKSFRAYRKLVKNYEKEIKRIKKS
ncbi:glycosyltransferase family 2 protein [Thermosipho melanesiensis]|uniref:Glycosyl transferase, family 2 n=2 Tax=Thermosipho melanesiensis TaxID=46541 RepID=A6LLX7_THEM4|nr:glycosyltransferase [Thermosipho melanesiensis]ABR30928.1 glycosyl transferase, family 2 [Thermosipho melanesiensis BI429]APT74043.1 glycosyl transferase family 2 [Thermosipho melanesiensis]